MGHEKAGVTTGVVTLMWPKDICIAFVFVICGNTPGRLARKAEVRRCTPVVR